MSLSTSFLVAFPWLVLLAGALLQVLLGRLLPARAKGWLAFATSLAALAGVLALWPAVLSSQVVEARLASWDGPAALVYTVDGLSLLFALLAAGIGSAVLLYSIDYMRTDPGATRFYALVQVFIAGLIHLVFSADLLVLYLSWEVIGLCSFLLVGFWSQQREAALGARKVFVMTHLAGYGLLAVVLSLYNQTGTTLWTDPQVKAAFSSALFFLALLSAVAKSVQFPLHTWIPDAMAAPTPVSALLHAACYVKAGVYLIARLHSFGAWPEDWGTSVVWIGTVTLLVGGLFALIQSDLKRMLAFSTVSQIGYMLLGLGLGTPLGLAAGLLHCLNHALFKGGLFLCAGSVQKAAGTRDMDRLGGLARFLPRTSLLWLILAGSIAGVPLLSGFASKWLLYNAALEAGQVIPAILSWLVSLITVFYFLKATSAVFFGDRPAGSPAPPRTPRVMLAGTGVLAAFSLLLGVAPQIAVEWLINPILPALGSAPAAGITWLGITTGSGGWFATAGLILAVAALIAGGLIFYIANPGRGLVAASLAGGEGAGVFTGGEPLTGPGRLSASDFSLYLRQALEPFYRWADPDRYYLRLWRLLLQGCEWLGRGWRWLEGKVWLSLAAGVALLGLLVLLLPSAGVAEAGESGPPAEWLLPAAMGVSLLCLLAASSVSPTFQQTWPLMAGAGCLAIASLLISHPIWRALCLEGAALLALLLVWRTSASRLAARVYLAVTLVAAVAMLAVASLPGVESSGWLLWLWVLSIVIKLALFPLFLWLPLVAQAVPAPVAGLVIAVVDVAAFGELAAAHSALPFQPGTPWSILATALAVLTALTGAALMLAERDLKRLLAFSSIEDMGYLFLALVLGGELGWGGALAGIAAHSIAKAALFASLSPAEAEGRLSGSALAARYPWAGATFLLGALAMLGVPPTLGYIARWRIYAAAAQISPWLLGLLLLASGLALLAYLRALAFTWWGGRADAQIERIERSGRETRLYRFALLLASLALLVAGLWPRLFGG